MQGEHTHTQTLIQRAAQEDNKAQVRTMKQTIIKQEVKHTQLHEDRILL